jgi:RES domain
LTLADDLLADALPRPGNKPPDFEPQHREAVVIWRLHWEPDAELFTIGPGTPRWRFDDPRSHYAVSYGNDAEHGAFVEVYGDIGRIGPRERRRRLSLIRSQRPLLLLDMDNPKTQRVFGLDARISTSKQYGSTRAWGRAWHDWYEPLDGIRFLARKESRTLNYCLFLDRCGDELRGTHFGSLGRMDRRRILALIDGYGITLEF